jgi:hypothetical protein
MSWRGPLNHIRIVVNQHGMSVHCQTYPLTIKERLWLAELSLAASEKAEDDFPTASEGQARKWLVTTQLRQQL